jgi:hypothetical protein
MERVSTERRTHEKGACAKGLSRRKFMGRTATAVAGFSLLPRHVLGGARSEQKPCLDAEAMKATNAPETDKFFKESLPLGWEPG